MGLTVHQLAITPTENCTMNKRINVCPECGNHNAAYQQSCTQCSAALPVMAIMKTEGRNVVTECPNCNNNIVNRQTFIRNPKTGDLTKARAGASILPVLLGVVASAALIYYAFVYAGGFASGGQIVAVGLLVVIWWSALRQIRQVSGPQILRYECSRCHHVWD